jgi:exopolyphosphatase / guanosine-5'-triphosphate,3'-diphosphate pyrophosphatase
MVEMAKGSLREKAYKAAVIDIGSNTIHLLIADCSSGRVRPILDRRVRAGLGVAVANGAALGIGRIHGVASVVRAFAAEAREHRAREIIVVGTHAVRIAPNRRALIKAIEADAGVAVHVLSPEQEATLCVAGAELGPLPQPPFLCADIGGGSCDLAAVDAAGVRGVASLPVGSGVLAAGELDGDPPRMAEMDRTAAILRKLVAATDLAGYPAFSEAVATGGAVRRLGRQVRDQRGVRVQPTGLLLETIQGLLHKPSAAWPHAVKPELAAVVRAGGMILQAIAARWEVRRWRISPYGLREGVLAFRARGLSLEAAVLVGEPTTGRRTMDDPYANRRAWQAPVH